MNLSKGGYWNRSISSYLFLRPYQMYVETVGLNCIHWPTNESLFIQLHLVTLTSHHRMTGNKSIASRVEVEIKILGREYVIIDVPDNFLVFFSPCFLFAATT